MRLIDLRANDGSRQFGSLPQTWGAPRPGWELLKEQIERLAGVENVRLLADGVTEAWIDFDFRGHEFSVHHLVPVSEWWFFVEDPACPDDVLEVVLAHCSRISEAHRRG